MGALAVDLGGFGLPQTGFLGGIIGGVLAGVVAHWITRWKVPTWARGLMPVLVIPLLATLIAGFLMIVVLGKPLGWLMEALHRRPELHERRPGCHPARRRPRPDDGLRHGRPAQQGRLRLRHRRPRRGGDRAGDAPELKIMAAVMLAGMVPPLALALATVVRPGLFTVPERENGKAAWLLGASFITEGAIPFAAADPLRVIPSIMARQRRHRRPVAWRSTSASAHRTAASSCSSPSTTSSAS